VSDEKGGLEFLAARMETLLHEQRLLRREMDGTRDDLTVLHGMVQRLHGTVQGLVTELRVMHSRQARPERRVGKLEEERN